VKPSAVPCNAHAAVPAKFRVPLVYRRKLSIGDELLQLSEADSLQFNWGAGLGHSPSLLRAAGNDNRAAMSERTAIVTGAGKRVGALIVAGLIDDGWKVVAHVHHFDDEVPQGAVKAIAELIDPECATRIFAAAEGLPPVRLLVNNAARFAHDGFGSFDPGEFDKHMIVNARAPILLTEEFARRHQSGEEGLVVNLLDSKLLAPNPDFLSYTVSKQALAGFTELAALALAGVGIRANGIAPALMLRSAGQTEANFEGMHSANPLGLGVEPEHVLTAIRYLIDARTVTGQIITIDGGQRFDPPARDVQFMERR